MLTPDFWRNRSIIAQALRPLAILYHAARKLHVMSGSARLPIIPTICVGNLVAGGSGKTPTCLALATALQSAGRNPHIITRGYGGSIKTPTLVKPEQHKCSEVGDEAIVHAASFPCWVGADRIATIAAAAKAGADIAIMDDGLQNPNIKAHKSLLVIDGEYGLGNGLLLPAGPLRETVTEISDRIDAVMIIGDDSHNMTANFGHKPVFNARLVADESTSLKGQKIYAFAGIGRPEKFYNTLKNIGAEIMATRNFPDHFQYSPDDLQPIISYCRANNLLAVTTQKDHVRLPDIFKTEIKYLPVKLQFENAESVGRWLTTI